MAKEKKLTRKAFLKKSCAGIAGAFACNFMGRSSRKMIATVPARNRMLGRTGIKITPIGFGVSRIMEPALLRAALDRGINFLDTGRSYFNGRNETMLGTELKGNRQRVVIQSKMKIRLSSDQPDKNQAHAIKKAMESSLNDSLKALQTDYIDIMLIHGASRKETICHDTMMRFMEDAKRKGLIRAHGFSCHNELEPLRWASETAFYDVIMFPFNHQGAYVHMNSGSTREWDQPQVKQLIKEAHRKQIGIIAMKTCSAGPFSSDPAVKPSHPGALKWVISHEFIDSMAVAMVNFNQIDENAGAILGTQ